MQSKTILITGAASGIGRDSAYALAARGHRVIATTQTEDQAATLRTEASARGAAIEIFKLDITEPADRELILPLQLDVLINNAALGASGSLAEIDMNIVRRLFEVNLFATLELTQLALRGMIARSRGTVLLVSSVAGRVPVPFLMPYGMTKFALSAGSAGLREEVAQLRRNVHIALIEPGAFHTGFNQTMSDSKYAWMEKGSYFADRIARMQAEDKRVFKLIEARSTRSIVAAIVKAAEARKPRLRYVAPWYQGLVVRLARMVGI